MHKIFELRLFDGAATPQAPTEPPASNGEGTESKEKTVVYGIAEQKPEGSNQSENSSEESSKDERIKKYKEFIKENKDLYQEEVDKVINKRFKETKGLEERLKTINPLLDMLAQKYGKDSGDIQGLVDAYINDDSQYAQMAEDEGMTLEQAKKMKSLELFQKTQMEAINRQNAEATYEAWMEEAEVLKELYEDFDISEEIENPQFKKVLQNGFSVQQAYELVHPEASAERIKKEISAAVTTNIQKRTQRPLENGMTSGQVEDRRTDVTKFDKKDRLKAIEQSRKNGNGSVRFS